MSEIIAYFSSPETDAPLTQRELEDIYIGLKELRQLRKEERHGRVPDPVGMKNLEELIKRVYEVSGGTGDAL